MNNELQSDEKHARLAIGADGEPVPLSRELIDIPGGFKLLPPAANVCQTCARDHPAEWPHNADSLYFQYWFYAKNGRWPLWSDAMEHCQPEMRETWLLGLRQLKVPDDKIFADPANVDIVGWIISGKQ